MLNHVQFLRPHGLLPTRFLCPWHFPGKNTGVSYHFLLQGIILIQGSNLGFLCYSKSPALQAGSLPTEPPGKPLKGTFSSVQFSSVAQSCLTLCDPCTVACQAPPSMGFSRQEYWSELPFPSPGNILDPGTEPTSPASFVLAHGFFIA